MTTDEGLIQMLANMAHREREYHTWREIGFLLWRLRLPKRFKRRMGPIRERYLP